MSSIAQKGGITYEMIDLHNGKGYAGKDTNPKFVGGAWIARRPAVHFSTSKRGSNKCPLLNRAIRRNIRIYGKPYFYVIHHQDYQPTDDALCAAEKELIRVREYFTDRSKGYNLTEGGEGTLGYRRTPETIAKTSGENHYNYGKPAWNRGKKTPDEIIAKTSGENHYNYGKPAWNRGISPSSETIEKVSGKNHHMFGKSHKPETIEKMRESHLGEKNHMFGKQHSAETRKQISYTKYLRRYKGTMKIF